MWIKISVLSWDLGMIENLVKVWPLVLSLVSCTVNPAAADASEVQVPCPGGENCYPFIALLMNLHGICTAAIVSRNWMVSAAHCCKKPGGRTFLAYAGSGDVMAAERLQVRSAEAVMWADPDSGAVTQVAAERSSVVLLLTSAPWTNTQAVHPVGIGDIPPYPLVLRENKCAAAGFKLDKKLAVTPCNASAYWNTGAQTCSHDEGSCMFAMAPGSLLYCFEPDVVIGVSLCNGDSLPNSKDGSLKTCFANLGGAVMLKLLEIADNESLAYELRARSLLKGNISHVHLEEANQVDRFNLANTTATQLHNKSNLDHSKVNERWKDVVIASVVRKRDVDENEKDDVAEYARNYRTTPAEVVWSLVFVPVVIGCLLLIYRTSVRDLFIRLYRYARQKSASRNNQSV